MYQGERRVSYGLIAIAIVLIGLLVAGGAILMGKSSSSPVVVIVTTTPLPLTNPMVQPTTIPLTSACSVPNVVGQDQSAAEGLITGIGLQPVKSTVYDANVPVGRVVSQNPLSEAKVSPCTGDVAIVISLGRVPEPTNIPTLVPPSPEPTSIPTLIPPTLTIPPSNTPLGSRLKPGDTWIQDNFEVTLRNPTFLPGCGGALSFEMSFVNNTGRELVISTQIGDQEHFSVKDDTGQSYTDIWWQAGKNGGDCYRTSIGGLNFQAMSAGQVIDLTFRVIGSLPQRSKQITVTINRVSKINSATWVIDIPR